MDDAVDEYPVPIGQRPTWLQILECFANELDNDTLLGWAHKVNAAKDLEIIGELGFKLVHHGKTKVAQYARQQIRMKAEPSMTVLTTEQRKAIVINALGYDPAGKRPPVPCFIPPQPTVDVSDFPDGSDAVMSWKGPVDPSPTAPKPDDRAPWHDKEELAKSRDRIAAYMASDKYLFKNQQPCPPSIAL